MAKKSDEMKRLESNVANIMLGYKANRNFRVQEIAGKLKSIGFPYIYKSHYQRIWRLVQDFVMYNMVEVMPKKKGAKRTTYKIVDIERLHEILHSYIDPNLINSKVIHIDPVTIVDKKETPTPSEKEPEIDNVIDNEIPRPDQCLLEIMEYMADAPKNEFTPETIYTYLCKEGLDVTLREVRISTVSLAKENIIRVTTDDLDVYRVINHEAFYKRLNEVRRKEFREVASLSNPSWDEHKIGECVVTYALNLDKALQQKIVELEEMRVELNLYKEEESKLRERVGIIEKKNIELQIQLDGK